RPLRALSGNSYADEGRVLIGPIDGQVQGCLWHRLFAEAALADGGAIELALAASDIDTVPSMPDGPDDTACARHVLLPGSRRATDSDVPVAAWLGEDSEIAHAPPLLRCSQRPGMAGLFDCLIQRPGRKVRRIEGRYLWIALTLSGDRRTSPELAAVRVYARRRSWLDLYLPGLYSETL